MTRDFVLRHHHVARCIASDHESGSGDVVFLPVDERYEASTRCRGGARGPRALVARHRRNVAGADELRGATLRIVGIPQLEPGDLDLVPVHERRGFRPEQDAVHADVRRLVGAPDGRRGSSLDDGLHRNGGVARHRDVGAGSGPDSGGTRVERKLLVVELKDGHGGRRSVGLRHNRHEGSRAGCARNPVGAETTRRPERWQARLMSFRS